MNSRKTAGCLALVGLLLTTSVFMSAQVATLKPSSLNFGNQLINTTSAPQTVHLSNTGTAPLVVLSITPPSAPFADPKGTGACPSTSFSLAPGTSCTISVTFSPISTGTFPGSISITDNAPGSPQTIKLTGTGVPQAALSPASQSFGSVGVGTPNTKTLTINNYLNTALAFTAAASGDFAVTANSCSGSVAANGHCSISVTYTPTQLGARTGTLTVTDSANNSPQMATLTGTGTTSSVTSISVTPANSLISVGANQSFTATGNFPSGITQNLTNLVTWSSSSSKVASISNTVGSQGVATGKVAGTTKITATLNENKYGSTSLTVTAGGLITPAISWVPGPITYGTPLGAAQLDATASAGGTSVPGSFAYTPGAGALLGAGSQTLSVIFTPTDMTHYTTATGSASLTVNPATPVVSVTGGSFAYDGNSHAATATATGIGGAIVSGTLAFTYNGSSTMPTAAASYTVNATFTSTNPNYGNASGSGTLTITAATPVVSVTGGSFAYDGNSHAATATATGIGGAIVSGTLAFTYNGSSTMPTAAASYTVNATFTSTNPNYGNASGSGTLTITAATPVVSVTGGSFAYDGNSHAATATATGIGGAAVSGAFSFTYNGSVSAPVAAGIYSVIATFTSADPNYVNAAGTGSIIINAAATLVSIAITPANSAVALGKQQPLTATGNFSDGTMQDLTGSAAWSSSNAAVATVSAGLVTATSTGSGGPVAISATSGSITGSTTLTVTNPGGSSFAGNMATARDPHTATALVNGKILIAGGYGAGGVVQSSAELYDPSGLLGVYSTSPTGGMSTPRAYHTATLLNNGKVLIVGGLDSGYNALATAELYDPPSGTFSSTGSLGTAREGHTATLLNDGTVLIVGGGSGGFSSGIIDLDTAEIYVPATGLFTAVAGYLQAPEHSHTATLLLNSTGALVGGGVLIAGGYSSGVPTNNADVYDPSCSCIHAAWDASGNVVGMVSLRAQHTATQLSNGLILIAGGAVDSFGASTNSAELYDGTTGLFTQITSTMSSNRSAHTATALTNNMVVLAGGAALNTVDLYDPSTNQFSPLPPLVPTLDDPSGARLLQTANLVHCVCIADGWVILEGGSDVNGVALQSMVWAYEPTSLAPPGLTAVQVSPASPPPIPLGTTLQFSASGTTGPLPNVTWNSSDNTILTITNDATNSGLAIPVKPGSVTVSACLGSLCSSVQNVTVAPAALVSIAVTPTNPYIVVPPAPPAPSQIFVATGTYTDKSKQDLSNAVVWSSSVSTVATLVNNVATPPTPPVFGQTTITATDPATGLVGSTVLTVTNFSANQLPAPGPGTRCCMGMVFVPSDKSGNTNYTLFFGGYDGATPNRNDTWAYTNGTWTQLSPGSSPSVRSGMAMAYDPAHRVVVMFGGIGAVDLNDTWIWDGTNWTDVTSTAGTPPAGRRWDTQGMTYDAAHGNVLLFGGVNSSGTTFFNDTWTFDGSVWTQQAPGTSPSGRRAPLAYDPATGNVVLFGGETSYGLPALNDTWTWDGSNWTQQSPPNPPPARTMASLVYDASSAGAPTSGRLVVFGGSGSGSTPPYLNDTWVWDGTTWSQVYPNNPPPERYAFGMVFDPSTGLLVYGGLDLGDSVVLSDMWVLAP
jgi:hypothetical protein